MFKMLTYCKENWLKEITVSSETFEVVISPLCLSSDSLAWMALQRVLDLILDFFTTILSSNSPYPVTSLCYFLSLS